MVNLDIDFARGGNDPFAYVKARHDRITHLHVRDQKQDGTAANIGEGDLQVAAILRTIRDNAWPIACILEQGRTGFDSSVAATRANLDYMRPPSGYASHHSILRPRHERTYRNKRGANSLRQRRHVNHSCAVPGDS